MKNTKRKQNGKNQLNSNPTLFFQLGILLALIIVYSTFEIKFSKKIFKLPNKSTLTDEAAVFVFPPIEIEKQKTPKEVVKQKLPKLLTKIKLIDDDAPSKENFLKNEPTPPINFDSIFSDVPIIEEAIKETLPFILVEQAPRFPGCKEKSEKEYKKCFNAKIKKFIAKKFNANINTNLKGKQRISVQFEIDKNGNIVNIRARAPHKNLEKEAIKVIHRLPKMQPGLQRNNPVGVKYTLPISIYLE